MESLQELCGRSAPSNLEQWPIFVPGSAVRRPNPRQIQTESSAIFGDLRRSSQTFRALFGEKARAPKSPAMILQRFNLTGTHIVKSL